MSSSHLLIAIAVGLIFALIIYWWNPEALQNDINEPNLLYVFLIGLVIAALVFYFLRSNGFDLL